MAATATEAPLVKRTLWLAIVIGWLGQLGLSTLLPVVAEVVGRSWALAHGNTESWAEHTNDASRFGWQVIQGVILIASLLGGLLAGYIAPRRPILVAVALVLLSLLVTFFQQLPQPHTSGILLIWALAPCVGLVLGVAVAWRVRQNAA